MKYIAFLRGINVGGNKKVPMSDLKKVCEDLGFTNLQTVLNSGNVVFDANENNVVELTNMMEKKLQEKFGFDVPVIIRTSVEIENLLKRNPFKDIEVTKYIRLYVTFLSEKPKGNIVAPYTEGGSTILDITDTELCIVLDVTKDKGTTDAMKLFEREFGKNITTRNWNTVERIGKLLF